MKSNNKELKDRTNAIVMGHCNIFGEIPNGTNPNLIIIALAKDRTDGTIDALFYETDRYGEMHYGVARDVIVWENKVCWNGGSANWMSAVDGYRHFQYRIDRETGLLWHSYGWNKLLDEVGPHLMVSSDQVVSALWFIHCEACKEKEVGEAVDLVSYEYLHGKALKAVLMYVVDGGYDIDQAWYNYQMTGLDEDLKAAFKFADKLVGEDSY